MMRKTVRETAKPTADGADPKITAPVFVESTDNASPKRRIAITAKLVEMNTVEPNQTILCSEPEVTIAGLQDGVNGRLYEPLFLIPNPMRVLRKLLIGI